MSSYTLLLLLAIQLFRFNEASPYQEEQKVKCAKKTDCFSCSKMSNCLWRQTQCEYSPSQRGWLNWYDKFTSCKYQDASFKNNTEKYCVNLHSNNVPFKARLSPKAAMNNITDVFCDWSISSLSPYKEYKFIFYFHNITKFYKSNFVLVLLYPDGAEEKRLYNNYFNKTIGIIGFSLYYHSREIDNATASSFTFKVEEVKLFSFRMLLVVLIGFTLICLGCIGVVVYKNRQIQSEKEDLYLEAVKNHLRRIGKVLHPTQYQAEKEGQEKRTCSICLEDFTPGVIVSELICHHVFHYNCIRRWVETVFDNPKCPNCNKYLLEELKGTEGISLVIESSVNNSFVVLG